MRNRRTKMQRRELRRAVGLTSGSLALVVAGAVLIADGDAFGWAAVLFFLPGVVFGALMWAGTRRDGRGPRVSDASFAGIAGVTGLLMGLACLLLVAAALTGWAELPADVQRRYPRSVVLAVGGVGAPFFVVCGVYWLITWIRDRRSRADEERRYPGTSI